MDLLPRLRAVDDRYATRPISEAFNWQEAASDLGDGEWYLVAFRSMRRDGADEERLAMYDERAHLEAESAPGFVHYFKGPRAADGSCLSFCLWTSRAEARAAAGRPAHVEAVGLLDEMYATYTLEFHRVRREAGGPLTFVLYDAPTVDIPLPAPDAAPPQLAFRPAAAS